MPEIIPDAELYEIASTRRVCVMTFCGIMDSGGSGLDEDRRGVVSDSSRLGETGGGVGGGVRRNRRPSEISVT